MESYQNQQLIRITLLTGLIFYDVLRQEGSLCATCTSTTTPIVNDNNSHQSHDGMNGSKKFGKNNILGKTVENMFLCCLQILV